MMWFVFDAMFPVVFTLVLLVMVGVLISVPVRLFHERRQIEQTWHEGYQHALTVHQDMWDVTEGLWEDGSTVSSIKGVRESGSAYRSRSDAWAAGYRQAVLDHGWRWSERDSQELWHNPHTAGDAARIIARRSSPTSPTIHHPGPPAGGTGLII